MSGRKIAHPKILFNSKKSKTTLDDRIKKERLICGHDIAGMIIDITKDGIYINGYYHDAVDTIKYANLREPVYIAWEDLEKAKVNLAKKKTTRKPKKKRKKTIEPDAIEKPTAEYLSNLPIVTINGRKFYIDAEKKQRMPVDKPEQIYNFK